jgi:hypothetical protein
MPAGPTLPGSVAALRELVGSHPHLIHHYTFEGTTREEKCRDQQGDLHLMEVVMSGGRGGAAIDFASPGVDVTTESVAIHRGLVDGDANGVALQSEDRFQPPRAMTIELLMQFTGFQGQAGGVAAAIATRDSRKDCSFFLAAVDGGRLAHLFDGNEPWLESQCELIVGDWYYVASTFEAGSDRTRVNTFVANLSQNETSLEQVVRDGAARGHPAAGRLGIGKALDDALAHAYPWAGRLDEIAVYDAAIDRETLNNHLQSLVASGP